MNLRSFFLTLFLIVIVGIGGFVFASLTFSHNPSVEKELVAVEQKPPEEILYRYPPPFSQRDFFEEEYTKIPATKTDERIQVFSSQEMSPK